ncbi:hypothetical protein Tco_0570353 [Tanacetum coccineum]
MRIDPAKNQKEAIYQVVLDILKLSSCYNAFLVIADVPEIYIQVPNKEFVAPPPHDALVTFLNQLGYKGSLDLIFDLYGLFYKKNVDYAELIWEDFQYQIDYRQTSVKRRENMPYPRFTKVIIHYFLLKHKSIPKRYGSFINTIKDDGVLVPKKGRGKGKDLMSKKATSTSSKKGSISAEDNIIPNPDVALKLRTASDEVSDEEELDNNPHAKVKELVLHLRFPMSQRENPQTQVKELGYDEEVIISSDDKRTESEREVDESENDDEEVYKDDEVHDDDKDADEEKVDVEMIDSDKTKKPELPPSTSSLSLSSDYGNQFLNVSFDISRVRTIIETADTEINTLLDVLVQQEIPYVQQTPLLDVLVSVIPTMTNPIPSLTPPTTEVQATTITTTDPSLTVLLRLFELERKVEALSKVGHSEVIYNEVQTQLPKAVSDFVESRMESTVRDVLQNDSINLKQKDVSKIRMIKLEHATKEKVPKYLATPFNQAAMDEYNQKDILFKMMRASKSYNKHQTHKALYDALVQSLLADDDDMDRDSKKERKKQRRKATEPSKKSSTSKESSRGKTPPKTSKTDKSMTSEDTIEELVHEVAMDVEEPILDNVINDDDQLQDDADLKKDKFTWFK